MRFVVILAAGLAALASHLLTPPDTDATDAVVASPCTEAAFDAALATAQSSGLGTITFACGADATIVFTSSKTIEHDVTIDGGGLVTLSGGNATPLMTVDRGSLTLLRIVVANGLSSSGGGALVNLPGSTLVLAHTIVRNNVAGETGGGILNSGRLAIRDSVFHDNRAQNGGAIETRWRGTITHIRNTVFHDNMATSTDEGWGGALLVWDGAKAHVEGGEIHDNAARLGAGIHNTPDSQLTLSGGVVVRNNHTPMSGGVFEGGGIFNLGRLALDRATVRDNSAGDSAGVFNGGIMTAVDSTFSGNQATAGDEAFGGGLTNSGTCTLERVTVSANSGGFSGGGILSDGILTATNVTIAGNDASYGGGIYVGGGTTTLVHATIAGNASQYGAIGNEGGGTMSLRNVVLANDGAAGNCFGPATSFGSNVANDTDADCGLTQLTDRDGIVDPELSPLADNGGPTETMLPVAESPLVDTVQCAPGITIDQRGAMRPSGTACDVGAVEWTATPPTSTSTTTPFSTTTTTLGTSLLPEARKLIVKQNAKGEQRLVVVLGGPDVSAATPCEVDGMLAMKAKGSRTRTIPLEPALWVPLRAGKPEKGCKCSDGPMAAAVRLKAGRLLRAKAVGDLGIPLDADPTPIRIEVRHGDRRHCVEFHASRFKPNQKLVATGTAVSSCLDTP